MRGMCLSVIVRPQKHADKVDQNVLRNIGQRRVLLPKRRKLYDRGLMLWQRIEARQRPWSLLYDVFVA